MAIIADETYELGIADMLKKSKGINIIFSLLDAPKGINEIQSAVGGSATTVGDRIAELIKDGYVSEAKDEKFPFTRLISLTAKGELAARALQNVRNDALNGKLTSERHKWLLSIIYKMNEVKGITRLEKLLFLLKEHLQMSDKNFYVFVPEKFGPYSKEVLGDIYELMQLQLINIEGDNFENKDGDFIIRWNFTLSEFGNNTAKIALTHLNTEEKKEIEAL